MRGSHDDIVLQKAAIIKRCTERIQEEYNTNPELDNYTHIDALTLNIERACQASIDIAMHLAAKNKLGLPQTSGEAFMLLKNKNLISEQTAKEMVAMTGFRNIAVHEYQRVDKTILEAIAHTHYQSFIRYLADLGINIQ